MIVMGICAMLILAVGVIFFVILYQRRVISHQLELKRINKQREKELIQASIQSEESERMRIASELHDDVGATLASARLFLYKAKDAAYDDNAINHSKKLLDESISKIRSISHNLQPVSLQYLGLELSLRSLIETLNQSGSINAVYSVKNLQPRMADHTELAAYRICQELTTNIIKHSLAQYISLETATTDESINIVFTHDGKGMTQEFYEQQIYKKGAIGLKNIVNRLKSIHGVLHFYKEAHLYKTELRIPLTAENTYQ